MAQNLSDPNYVAQSVYVGETVNWIPGRDGGWDPGSGPRGQLPRGPRTAGGYRDPRPEPPTDASAGTTLVNAGQAAGALRDVAGGDKGAVASAIEGENSTRAVIFALVALVVVAYLAVGR